MSWFAALKAHCCLSFPSSTTLVLGLGDWPVSGASELLSDPGFCFYPPSASIQQVRPLLRPSQSLGGLRMGHGRALPHPRCSNHTRPCAFFLVPSQPRVPVFTPRSLPVPLPSVCCVFSPFTAQRPRVILPHPRSDGSTPASLLSPTSLGS